MARKRREKVKEPLVTGTKYLRELLPLLERLHDDGCARDKAGNHRLHVDQYCTLILPSLCNPVVVSLQAHEMICSNFSGVASEEELLAHSAK
jgi:hypothetical protein